MWSIEITKVVCGLLRSPRVVIFLCLKLCYLSCVEVIVEEFVGIPLSVEVIVVVIWLCVLSL